MNNIKKFDLEDGTYIRYTEQGSGRAFIVASYNKK